MSILDPKIATSANTKHWLNSTDGIGCDRLGGAPVVVADVGPGLVQNALGAYPCIRTNHGSLVGPAGSALVGASAKSIYFVFRARSVTTDASVINQNECLFNIPNCLGIWLRNYGGTNNDYRMYGGHVDGTGLCLTPNGISIQLNTIYVCRLWHNGTTLKLVRDILTATDATHYKAVASGASIDLTGLLTIGKGAVGVYADVDFFEMICRNLADTDEVGESIFAYQGSHWGTRPDANVQARDHGSRRLWSVSHVPRAARLVTKRLDVLDLKLGDSLAFRDARYPHRDGYDGSVSEAVDKRPEIRIERMVLRGQSKTVEIQGLERRHRDALAYATFIPTAGLSCWNNGPAMMLPGGAMFRPCYTPGSVVGATPWRYLRRTGDNLVAKIGPGAHVYPLESDGLVVEPLRWNRLLHSSFISGNTGWTRSAGGGGATPAAEALTGNAPALFDGVTGFCMALVQDASPTREKGVGQVTAAHAWNDAVVSIDHRDDSGAVLYWRLQRSSDSKFWNDSTPGWQVASVDNAMPQSGASSIDRFESQIVTTGGGAAHTYTLTVLQQAGGTGGRVNRCYHLQLEESVSSSTTGATSRIVTTTAEACRVNPSLTIDGSALAGGEGSHLFNWDCGTILCAFVPCFDATKALVVADPTKPARLGGLYAMLLGVGPETVGLQYRFDQAKWYASDSGGTHVATVDQPTAELTSGSAHVLAWRWSRDVAREDVPADSMSIVVDDHAGAAAQGPHFGGALRTHAIQFGYPDTDTAGAWRISALRSVPRVYSPAEVLAWGRRHGVVA